MNRDEFINKIKLSKIAGIIFDAADNGSDPFKVNAISFENGHTLYLRPSQRTDESVLVTFEYTAYLEEEREFYKVLSEIKAPGIIEFKEEHISKQKVDEELNSTMHKIGAIGWGRINRGRSGYTTVRFDSND